MNILYITNHLNIGGITSYCLTLATGLKQRGHNIYIASSGGQLLNKFMEMGAVCIPIPIKTKKEISPKILASMSKLCAQARKYNFDIIHAHTRTTQVLGCLLSRRLDTPYISTCHGFFKKRILRLLFPCWGAKVIAISEPVKEHLIKDFGIKDQDIRVIHNGIDVDRFRVQSTEHRVQKKKELGLGDGPIIGIVARLSDVKGHIYLIEAMRDIVAKFAQAQLLIVGEGKQKEELVTRVNNLGISRNIIFYPEVYPVRNTEEKKDEISNGVYDTKDVLSIMDLFVMPSLKEGLGLSLMEAMASGLAVVASNVGGIKSLIQDRYNGLLVKPRDTRDLATKILELLQDTNKREILGKNAQVFIAENFSLRAMVLETERVYLECLREKY